MWIVIAIIAVIVIYVVYLYNSLISLKNRVDNGWAQIDTQLQRRYDLIPNLIETVKGYAAHEKEVFENVTKARADMKSASTVAEKASADNAITDTLKSLFAVAEAYPDLKANQNFKELQMELTNTENKISFARQFYNDVVTQFNTALEVFPKNIVASMLHFTPREYFEVENEEAKKAPKVQF
jgi:LemA protein